MAFPPNEVTATELFLKLSSPVRPSEVVDFPRRDPITRLPVAQVRIQVLNLAEYDEARIKAHYWVIDKKRIDKSQLEGQTIKEVLGDRVAKELISMACLSVEPIKGTEETGVPRYLRHFLTADHVDVLMADELEALWMTHQMIQRKWGPYEGNIETAEQATAWMKRLVEGGSAIPLGVLGWHHLVELTTLLAERAYSLSALLGTLSSNWPSGLAANLTSWDIGSSSYGKLPASAIEIGLQNSDLGIEEGDPDFIVNMRERDAANLANALAEKLAPTLPDRPITTQEAANVFKEMFKDNG